MGNVRALERTVVFKNGRKRTEKPRMLTNSLLFNGYLRVGLSKNDVNIGNKVHRLVATAFIENPLCKSVVNHINGIKTDNRVENLEWCTAKENGTHASQNNLYKSAKGSEHYRTKLTEADVIKIREMGEAESAASIARKLGISYDCIAQIISRRRWKHI